MGGFSDQQKSCIADNRIRDIAMKNDYLGTHIVLKEDVTKEVKDFYVIQDIYDCISQLKN